LYRCIEVLHATADRKHPFDWIPSVLPPRVRMVVSALTSVQKSKPITAGFGFAAAAAASFAVAGVGAGAGAGTGDVGERSCAVVEGAKGSALEGVHEVAATEASGDGGGGVGGVKKKAGGVDASTAAAAGGGGSGGTGGGGGGDGAIGDTVVSLLRNRGYPRAAFVNLEHLTVTSRNAVILEWLRRDRRVLTPGQTKVVRAALRESLDAGNGLYLKMIHRHVKAWTSAEDPVFNEPEKPDPLAEDDDWRVGGKANSEGGNRARGAGGKKGGRGGALHVESS
jgi:hypothetical protein